MNDRWAAFAPFRPVIRGDRLVWDHGDTPEPGDSVTHVDHQHLVGVAIHPLPYLGEDPAPYRAVWLIRIGPDRTAQWAVENLRTPLPEAVAEMLTGMVRLVGHPCVSPDGE
jgi:hypothetical protein